jgi:shikimate dehydrogenase
MIEDITSETAICAVFGFPVKHSASPIFQNAGIKALGLNWRYLAFEVRPEELSAALLGARAMRFIGINLTLPHKQLALKLMDVLDESAVKWGAVNTIRFEGLHHNQWIPLGQASGNSFEKVRLVGFNTDADAIVSAIQEDFNISVQGKRILILGAGGAGRTAALKLAESNVDSLWLVNRTESKAVELAQEICQKYKSVKVCVGYPTSDIDLTINATSLGLKPEDPLPLDLAKFSLRQTKYAFDMIYKPQATKFLIYAKESGCITANGTTMLLHQGAKALELWSNLKPPVNLMRSELIHYLQTNK